MTHGPAHMPFFQYLNNLGLFVISIILSWLLGRITHELTHVLVANALGHKVNSIKIRLFSGKVSYTAEEGTPIWHVLLINSSPIVVGIFSAAIFVGVYWNNWPSALAIWVLFAGWSAYTIAGGASDWSLTAAKGDGHLWHPDRGEQLLVVGLGLVIAAFIGSSITMLGDYRISLGLGLSFAGFVVAGMGVWDLQATKT